MKKFFKVTALALVIALAVGLLTFVGGLVAAPETTVTTAPVSEAVGGAASNNPYIVGGGRTMISAHRAGGALAPENTLMAFENCLNSDYVVDVLEFDLHITADEQLILLHDETLDRTSNASELFFEDSVAPSTKTLEQLKKLNMGENFVAEDGSYPYKGLRGSSIPANLRVVTLTEVLDYAEGERPDGSLTYIIEIKDSGAKGKLATQIMYDELKERGLLDRVIIGTFNGDISDYIDEINANAAESERLRRSSGIIEVLKAFIYYLLGMDLGEVGYDVMQLPYLSWFPFLGSAGFIEYAHSYGLACQYWTVNDASQMQTLIANGADCIITDDPQTADRVVNGVFGARR